MNKNNELNNLKIKRNLKELELKELISKTSFINVKRKQLKKHATILRIFITIKRTLLISSIFIGFILGGMTIIPITLLIALLINKTIDYLVSDEIELTNNLTDELNELHSSIDVIKITENQLKELELKIDELNINNVIVNDSKKEEKRKALKI